MDGINIKQLKWILKKAYQVLDSFDRENKLDQSDFENLATVVDLTVEQNKNNSYCQRIMLDVAEAVEISEKEKM